jgi:hypothetical protein
MLIFWFINKKTFDNNIIFINIIIYLFVLFKTINWSLKLINNYFIIKMKLLILIYIIYYVYSLI